MTRMDLRALWAGVGPAGRGAEPDRGGVDLRARRGFFLREESGGGWEAAGPVVRLSRD